MQENNPNGIQLPDKPKPFTPQTPQTSSLTPPPIRPPEERRGFAGFFKDNKWAIYLIVLSLLVISGMLVYFLKRPAGTPSQPKVQLTIDAPNEVSSGSEVMYQINFANQDSSPLQKVSLDLIYPSGFTFEDSTPKADRSNGTHFELPNNIEPSQSGTLMIRGSMVGNAGEVKSIRATMHYSFANFKSAFITDASSQTTISESNVALQFSGASSLANNNSTTYNLTWQNTSQQDFSGLKLHVDLPGTFKVEKYSTQPDIGTDWNVGSLKPGDEGKLSITGHFENANVGDTLSFQAKMTGPDQTGQMYTISSTQYFVNLTAVPITTTLKVQAQSFGQGDATVTNPGDALSYTLHYQNNNSVSVHGVSVIVTVNGDAVHLSSIQAPNASIAGNTITWDASGVSQFNDLQPNSGGDLTFRVNVKSPATTSTSKNLTISAQAKIKSSEYPDGFSGDPLSLKVATVVSMETASSFATGANPPMPNQSTTYNVSVSLKNTTNDVNNSMVTFYLPRSQSFDLNSVSPAEKAGVSYDSSTKKVTWNIGKLSAHLGDFGPARKLHFSVTVMPNYTDLHQPMTLINNVRFSGTDSFTNLGISLGVDDLTTGRDPSGIVGGNY